MSDLTCPDCGAKIVLRPDGRFIVPIDEQIKCKARDNDRFFSCKKAMDTFTQFRENLRIGKSG
ncbi:hypothetical protein GCM10022398_32200 [Acetobacter lovaniensis]|nr:hypothetical protein AA0474_1047 [Acetobacter lovaniensis NRIC 0474]